MFNNYSEEKRKPLTELYNLMLNGDTDLARKKQLKSALRSMGLLSLPFSLNKRKFKPMGEY